MIGKHHVDVYLRVVRMYNLSLVTNGEMVDHIFFVFNLLSLSLSTVRTVGD